MIYIYRNIDDNEDEDDNHIVTYKGMVVIMMVIFTMTMTVMLTTMVMMAIKKMPLKMMLPGQLLPSNTAGTLVPGIGIALATCF